MGDPVATEGVSKLGRVKEVDEQIPSDAATQYRTVGGSQWMLALNYIRKTLCFPCKFGRETMDRT